MNDGTNVKMHSRGTLRSLPPLCHCRSGGQHTNTFLLGTHRTRGGPAGVQIGTAATRPAARAWRTKNPTWRTLPLERPVRTLETEAQTSEGRPASADTKGPSALEQGLSCSSPPEVTPQTKTVCVSSHLRHHALDRDAYFTCLDLRACEPLLHCST